MSILIYPLNFCVCFSPSPIQSLSIGSACCLSDYLTRHQLPGRRSPAGTRLAQYNQYEYPAPSTVLDQAQGTYLSDLSLFISLAFAVVAFALFIRKSS